MYVAYTVLGDNSFQQHFPSPDICLQSLKPSTWLVFNVN